jgi:CRISPR-associated protein Csb1
MGITQAELVALVRGSSAFRRRRRLQPAGGVGDKLFPPTYPGEGRDSPPRHVFERRRLDGREAWCVLIDSVQSQANRLEEALLGAWTCPYQTGHSAWLGDLLAMNSRGERMRKPECGWMLL